MHARSPPSTGGWKKKRRSNMLLIVTRVEDTQAIENRRQESQSRLLPAFSVVSAQWKRTPRGCFIGATDTNPSEQEERGG